MVQQKEKGGEEQRDPATSGFSCYPDQLGHLLHRPLISGNLLRITVYPRNMLQEKQALKPLSKTGRAARYHTLPQQSTIPMRQRIPGVPTLCHQLPTSNALGPYGAPGCIPQKCPGPGIRTPLHWADRPVRTQCIRTSEHLRLPRRQ